MFVNRKTTRFIRNFNRRTAIDIDHREKFLFNFYQSEDNQNL